MGAPSGDAHPVLSVRDTGAFRTDYAAFKTSMIWFTRSPGLA